MKKVFMEPEVKVTKFEYEDIMFVGQSSSPEIEDNTAGSEEDIWG